ncbi:hypothetical protein CXG81DRAFT_25082 [Caulochytrium protostelioides]|uniref:Exonuclease domain-containing protein n=1 Tax=Caulochytrium protostelioides TaxID=1555241 RepID=A0A4P9XAE4_9FUNG|nr:hypothetical protein CXG81DRAFT_25082 [Caulochytrium protostelioides]|eukprot:RKP02302.1 hypothetical protein CXG81DRAFT_25082 [Caulochytrium protostelioides]
MLPSRAAAFHQQPCPYRDQCDAAPFCPFRHARFPPPLPPLPASTAAAAASSGAKRAKPSALPATATADPAVAPAAAGTARKRPPPAEDDEALPVIVDAPRGLSAHAFRLAARRPSAAVTPVASRRAPAATPRAAAAIPAATPASVPPASTRPVPSNAVDPRWLQPPPPHGQAPRARRDLHCAVPYSTRQRALDLCHAEFARLAQPSAASLPGLAAARALDQEAVLRRRAPAPAAFKNAVVNTLRRLRARTASGDPAVDCALDGDDDADGLPTTPTPTPKTPTPTTTRPTSHPPTATATATTTPAAADPPTAAARDAAGAALPSATRTPSEPTAAVGAGPTPVPASPRSAEAASASASASAEPPSTAFATAMRPVHLTEAMAASMVHSAAQLDALGYPPMDVVAATGTSAASVARAATDAALFRARLRRQIDPATAAAAPAAKTKPVWLTCAKCQNMFRLRWPLRAEDLAACVAHPERLRYDRQLGSAAYPCCGDDRASRGCQKGAHVYKETAWPALHRVIPFVTLPALHAARSSEAEYAAHAAAHPAFRDAVRRLPPAPLAVAALDCEMSYSIYGFEMTRLTIIDGRGRPVLDCLTAPHGPILDWNTRYSGVSGPGPEEAVVAPAASASAPASASASVASLIAAASSATLATTLSGAPPSSSSSSLASAASASSPSPSPPQPYRMAFSDLQRHVLPRVLGPQAILVGHGLENDLTVMRLAHDRVVDTAGLVPHPHGLPIKFSLAHITKRLLHHLIRASPTGGHDSLEDALAALHLVVWLYQHQDQPLYV